ncbi:MAG: hypothetical protein ACFCVA_09235 [Gammaproteobacteria bacterium]
MSSDHTALGGTHLLGGAWRYKYRILLATLIAVSATGIGSALTAPRYVARTSFVLQSAATAHLGTQGISTTGRERAALRASMSTALEILHSQYLKEQVLKALGSEELYPGLGPMTANDQALSPTRALPTHPLLFGRGSALNSTSPVMERALARFEEALAIYAEENARIIRLSFRHEDPDKAISVLESILNVFSLKHGEMYNPTDVGFMAERLSEHREALEGSEGAIQVLSERYGLFHPDEQIALLLKRRDRLDTASHRLEGHIKRIQEEIASLKQALQEIPSTVTLHTDVQETIDAFDRTERPRERYQQKMVRTGRNEAHEKLDLQIRRLNAELAGSLAERNEVAGQRDQVASELPRLTEGKWQLHRLTRELTVRESSYQTYLARLETARIQESLNRSQMRNIGLIQPPTATVAPLFDRRIAAHLLVGGIGGLLVSLLVAFIYAYRRRGLEMRDSLEKRFGIPVLATMPDRKRA